MQPKMNNYPPIGAQVFLPELQLWGEIVEYYDDNKQLITRVRALVNGKPTIIDVTNLIVDLANAVQSAAGLWQKIRVAVKSLCKKLGLCKPRVAIGVVPKALRDVIAGLEEELIALSAGVSHIGDYNAKQKAEYKLRAEIAKFKALLP